MVKGQLYAVGGFDGTTYLKNVETFDQEVTRLISFCSIALYLTFHIFPKAPAFLIKCPSIPVFQANNWKPCGAMNFRRLGGGVGVVKMPQTDAHFW